MQAPSTSLRKLYERQAAWTSQSSPGSTLRSLHDVVEEEDAKKSRRGLPVVGPSDISGLTDMFGGWPKLLSLSPPPPSPSPHQSLCSLRSPPSCSSEGYYSTASSSTTNPPTPATTTTTTPLSPSRSLPPPPSRSRAASSSATNSPTSRRVHPLKYNSCPTPSYLPQSRPGSSQSRGGRRRTTSTPAITTPDMLSSPSGYSYTSSPSSSMNVSPNYRNQLLPLDGLQGVVASGVASGSGSGGGTSFSGGGGGGLGGSGSGLSGHGQGDESTKKVNARKDSDAGKPRGGSGAGGGAGGGGGGGGKDHKKKAMKACLHCQKAHLTCDDSRPCQRCVKKGTADTCIDGQRKKAKYLMDEEEKAQARAEISKPRRSTSDNIHHDLVQPPQQSTISASLPTTSHLSQPQSSNSMPQLVSNQEPITAPPMQQTYSNDINMALQDPFPLGSDFLHDTDPIFNLNFDPAYQFDSHAANQEYTMLSSIFADASGNVTTPTSLSNPALSQPLFQLDPSWPDEGSGMQLDERVPDPFPIIGGGPSGQSQTNPDRFGAPSNSLSILGHGSRERQLAQNPFPDFSQRSQPPQPPPSQSNGGTTGGDSVMGDGSQITSMTPTMVYSQITKPYPYTEGYHFLMRYLIQNFEQADILKVVKSLAAFRPSLIALQMPLTVEDEVFLEKSFQRTLIELEKLISYSGTPTAVWRRTGEICLAGEEFCRLTEFSKSDLLAKKTFIYELFEKQSVIDYFEKFSQYAFENTTQNFFWQCVVITASGKPLPCSCSITIRRDVFDLPSVIIGQLLPMAS